MGLSASSILLATAMVSVHSVNAAPQSAAASKEVGESSQLILVTADDWQATRGQLQTFERDGKGHWKRALIRSGVALGRKGMGWGVGLHGGCESGAPCKREGDDRAPAGVFSLDEAFGWATAPRLRFPYRKLEAGTEAIDDPRSRYYNRLVEANKVPRKDWSTSEQMLRIGSIYQWGIVIRHNWQAQAGAGSCIFLHIWERPLQPTAGCTALPARNLRALLGWLDARKKPVLVQLPIAEYLRRRAGLGLPGADDHAAGR